MISSIHSLTPAQPAAQATAAQQTPSKATAQPSTADTVQISSAAKALSQENLETAAQTAHEASSGDVQAQRLLARHAAARASTK
jgi:hypothetical protein